MLKLFHKIDKKTGKVIVKAGPEKGTCKVKVKVKAAGKANGKPSAEKTLTFKIKLKEQQGVLFWTQ